MVDVTSVKPPHKKTVPLLQSKHKDEICSIKKETHEATWV
ncbi:hypothetical protein B4102_1412 [Heyndrickxia sporothermodurans]|uniref:Uncharacterized protein n=1 Tax=Heyndrickxia sporothermodurans TaxID=46224 RepID=A0A150KLS5_9BACI|nr:hypothetical protein B4102_1412 [Heyndrickxia sporothermodurans]